MKLFEWIYLAKLCLHFAGDKNYGVTTILSIYLYF